MTTTLVYGLAVAGRAVATELSLRGEKLVLVDDVQTESSQEFARSLDSRIYFRPSETELTSIIERVDRVVPAPGVSEKHQLFTLSQRAQKPMMSEIELAYQFEQKNPPTRPMVAVTGTDGKTTTTLMASAILNSAGHKSMAVGNTETPLISALRTDAQAFAVECSSFRLALTQSFRAKAAAWLNFAPDHLDWHSSMSSYEAAKAKIWAHTLPSDVAVVPSGNDVILAHAKKSSARIVSFGGQSGDYHALNGVLMGPSGEIMHSKEMSRSLPHDITNALAAAAITIESGLASPSQVADALCKFVNAAHRIEFVAKDNDIRWFNDSKATSPHAACVALKSFDSIVLIAGGKNKDLDLSLMAKDAKNVRAVVAIGSSAAEIVSAFTGLCEVKVANSMHDAVECASRFAKPGDVVLLSPGCTSFDWYKNYGERGTDFKNEVQKLIDKPTKR